MNEYFSSSLRPTRSYRGRHQRIAAAMSATGRIAAGLLFLFTASRLQGATALVGATVHPVASPPIEKAVVVIEDGLIKTVGSADSMDESMHSIDVAGKHIYPGLIAAYSHLGLVEIEAVRATRDLSEPGEINPNVSAHKAFTPDSELIPVTRSNGVLLALCAPGVGRLSGKSSFMRLAGWTWEDMLLEPDVALHIGWPRAKRDDPHDERPHDEEEKERHEHDDVESLGRLLDRAAAYAAAREAAEGAQEVDVRLEALQPFISGLRPVVVHAERQAEIEAAVSFFVRRNMRMILLGGYDADRCAPLLVENKIPVILTGVYRNPLRRQRAYDGPYTLPARLHAAGVLFCIAGARHDLSWNVRNLPYHAGVAAAFGLPRDEALKSITLNAARVLGVDDRVGSLEAGKHATMIVTNGDPLEMTTRVERAFVDGIEIDLADRHKRLRDRYRRRLDAE